MGDFLVCGIDVGLCSFISSHHNFFLYPSLCTGLLTPFEATEQEIQAIRRYAFYQFLNIKTSGTKIKCHLLPCHHKKRVFKLDANSVGFF
jgi:hypothetical protein